MMFRRLRQQAPFLMLNVFLAGMILLAYLWEAVFWNFH